MYLTHKFTDPCSPLSFTILKGETFHTVNSIVRKQNFLEKNKPMETTKTTYLKPLLGLLRQ